MMSLTDVLSRMCEGLFGPISSQVRFGHSGSGVHGGNVEVGLLRSAGRFLCNAGARQGTNTHVHKKRHRDERNVHT